MRCPFCGAQDTQVIDSRPVEDGFTIYRRRHCTDCGRRFTTYERREISKMITVIKKDSRREPYSREKIIDGLLLAMRKRPVTREKIEEIANKVENEILSEGEKEVTSRKIGELVLKHLRQVDAVAYVRFASVYREFKDIEEFTKELKRLQEEEGEKKGF